MLISNGVVWEKWTWIKNYGAFTNVLFLVTVLVMSYSVLGSDLFGRNLSREMCAWVSQALITAQSCYLIESSLTARRQLNITSRAMCMSPLTLFE